MNCRTVILVPFINKMTLKLLTDCQSSGSSRTSCLIFFTSWTFCNCSCAVRYSEHGPTLTNCKGLVACLGGVFKVVFNFGGSCVVTCKRMEDRMQHISSHASHTSSNNLESK